MHWLQRLVFFRRAFPLVALVLTLCPGRVQAQSKTYSLTPGGTWNQTREPVAGSDEAIISAARVDISKGQYSNARRALDRFIAAHENTTNEYLPQAYLLRGDTKLWRGWEESALRDYEKVIQDYPASDVFVRTLEREHEIGKAYLNGLKRRLFWMRLDSGESLGEEILIRVCERLPGSRLAEYSLLDLIDYYYRKPDLKMAATACRIYLGWLRGDEGDLADLAGLATASRPQGKNEMVAKMRLIQASVLRFAGPRYNAAPLEDAKLLIEQFANQYPNEAERTGIGDAMAARVDELLAQQMLETARWYVRRGDDVAARYTFRKLVRKYRETVAATDALDVLSRKGWGMAEGARVEATPSASSLTPAQPSGPAASTPAPEGRP
jgi:outer membrane protein assembly factor BamD (BamD/ComL family)